MSDEILAHYVPKVVQQLCLLNEQVVFRVKTRTVLGALEVEREPLLDSASAGPCCQIHEQRQVKHDWGCKDRVPAQEIDLDLHSIAKPSRDVDVVPAFFIITFRGVVVDSHLVIDVAIQAWIDIGLKDVLQGPRAWKPPWT